MTNPMQISPHGRLVLAVIEWLRAAAPLVHLGECTLVQLFPPDDRAWFEEPPATSLTDAVLARYGLDDNDGPILRDYLGTSLVTMAARQGFTLPDPTEVPALVAALGELDKDTAVRLLVEAADYALAGPAPL